MSRQPPVVNDFDSEGVVNNYILSKLDGIEEIRVNVIIDLMKEKGLLRDGEVSGTLLEIGCAHGGEARLLAKFFDHVIGIDASPLQISLAKKRNNPENVEFHVGSAENLSTIADDSIDAITAFFTLQLLDDVDAFINECRRVLKQGGIAIFYMKIVSAITSAGSDNLPTIVDRICKAHRKSLQIAKTLPHHQRHVLGHYQELFRSVNWENKSRTERKVDIVTTLELLRQCYLSVPFYAMLGDSSENPIVELFDEVKKVWTMEDIDDKVIGITATFDAVAITLESTKP